MLSSRSFLSTSSSCVADVVLINFRAADFVSQGLKDVTPEFFDTVGIHGQHVSVLEHVPEGTDVGGVAPKGSGGSLVITSWDWDCKK